MTANNFIGIIDKTDETDCIAGADENDVGTVIDGTIKEKNLKAFSRSFISEEEKNRREHLN